MRGPQADQRQRQKGCEEPRACAPRDLGVDALRKPQHSPDRANRGGARRIADLTEGQPFTRARDDLALTTGAADAALQAALSPYGITRLEQF